MTTYNCITNTVLLSVKRIGTSTFVAGAGETLTLDCGKLVSGILKKFNKIVGGVCVEMTAGEKIAVGVQDLLNEVDHNFILTPLLYPLGETEEISTNSTFSLDSFVSECSSNTDCILPDANIAFHAKKIIVQGGGSVSVTASMKSPFTGFDLGSNERATIVWSKLGGFWRVLEHKGIVFTP